MLGKVTKLASSCHGKTVIARFFDRFRLFLTMHWQKLGGLPTEQIHEVLRGFVSKSIVSLGDTGHVLINRLWNPRNSLAIARWKQGGQMAFVLVLERLEQIVFFTFETPFQISFGEESNWMN